MQRLPALRFDKLSDYVESLDEQSIIGHHERRGSPLTLRLLKDEEVLSRQLVKGKN